MVLVFDGSNPKLFENLRQWDIEMRRASQQVFAKLLVAARIDASPLSASRVEVADFCAEHGYSRFLETSAKTNQGCDELRKAIVEGIEWENIPWRSSPLLFKLLKEEIVLLKDEGRVLMRFNDLRDMLLLKLHHRAERFTDEQLKAVLSLLAGPGVVVELTFGGWVLFQPQLINVYAQAVLRTMRENESELGSIREIDVLEGNLSFHDMERAKKDDERFILLAMHQTLLERGLCSREFTDDGPVLVFPSYFKRHRPELIGHPAVLVSYAFEGFVAEIYSTLVVRLRYTKPFNLRKLWQDAADFEVEGGGLIGLKLTKGQSGLETIDVYCDASVPLGMKILFIRYVHEHLKQRALSVIRRRHYSCESCGNSLQDLDAVTRRLAAGKGDIGCPSCDERIALSDEIEKMYASQAMARKVQGLDEDIEHELDNESKERALVGEVISTVA